MPSFTGRRPADARQWTWRRRLQRRRQRDGDGQLNAQRDAPVGGQAVLEGVMMRGVRNWAVAVRKPTPAQLLEHAA